MHMDITAKLNMQGSMHGYGLASGASGGQYLYGGSYPSDFGSTPMPYMGPNDRTKYILEKSRRREKEYDSVSISNDSHVVDRNRGPRAAKLKGKGANEESSPADNSKSLLAMSTVNPDLYNRSDFVTDYENAKFFIIKSFSEDNVHKSIKYNVWASTPHGNKKLDAAYREAKEIEGRCPIFLLFSVSALWFSSQFSFILCDSVCISSEAFTFRFFVTLHVTICLDRRIIRFLHFKKMYQFLIGH